MSATVDSYAQGLAHSAARRHAEAIGCYEQALKESPDDIRVLFALGNTAAALGMDGPAEAFFRQVLAREPERAEALVNLGNLLRARGAFDAAEALLVPPLSRNSKVPELWLTLGSVYREKGDLPRAAAFYREALSLKPDYPAALGNLADILADEGDAAAALRLYDSLLGHEPDNAQARLNRAILHLLRGDLEAGWRDYEARLRLAHKVPIADHHLPPWDGASLAGIRLLVTAEQGVGDQTMFASLMPELSARADSEGGSVILACEPRLVTLFQRSFPRIAVRPSQIRNEGGVTHARFDGIDADRAIAMGSLPALMRSRIAHFPAPHAYLVPDKAEQGRWRVALAGEGPRIGLCWRSGKTGGARAVQYAPLEAWATFLAQMPGTPVCVQYDAQADEIAQLEALSGRRLTVPQGLDQKNELDRTAAMLSTLDAVVTAPTAVSWLAAAVGTPTFKILYDTSWTSFGTRHEPFAPACRVMMPAVRGDWADAFRQALDPISRPNAAA